MADLKETTIDRVQGEPYCTVYTTEKKYVNKLIDLKREHGDKVQVERMSAEDDDLYIQAKVPADWFKFVGPKRKTREMTDEEKALAAERLAKAREAKKKGKG